MSAILDIHDMTVAYDHRPVLWNADGADVMLHVDDNDIPPDEEALHTGDDDIPPYEEALHTGDDDMPPDEEALRTDLDYIHPDEDQFSYKTKGPSSSRRRRAHLPEG